MVLLYVFLSLRMLSHQMRALSHQMRVVSTGMRVLGKEKPMRKFAISWALFVWGGPDFVNVENVDFVEKVGKEGGMSFCKKWREFCDKVRKMGSVRIEN